MFRFLTLLLFASLVFVSCSDSDDDKTVDVSKFVAQMEDVRDEMETLRDRVEYGDKKDMYPQESKYILDDALIQIEKTIRNFKNGTETDPTQAKVDIVLPMPTKQWQTSKQHNAPKTCLRI